jgi:cytochrome b6-f complex subunit 4
MSTNHTIDKEDSVPFFPDHVRTEAVVVVILLVVVGLIGITALFSPVGLGDPADPMNTPAHVKPEWYFLALYQVLKYVPKTTGVVVPILLVLVMFVWPFIDRKKDRSPKTLRNRFIFVTISMVILVALTIWGEVS